MRRAFIHSQGIYRTWNWRPLGISKHGIKHVPVQDRTGRRVEEVVLDVPAGANETTTVDLIHDVLVLVRARPVVLVLV